VGQAAESNGQNPFNQGRPKLHHYKKSGRRLKTSGQQRPTKQPEVFADDNPYLLQEKSELLPVENPFGAKENEKRPHTSEPYLPSPESQSRRQRCSESPKREFVFD
jgi:hypothetical protein